MMSAARSAVNHIRPNSRPPVRELFHPNAGEYSEFKDYSRFADVTDSDFLESAEIR
jgi:hypothetical protein